MHISKASAEALEWISMKVSVPLRNRFLFKGAEKLMCLLILSLTSVPLLAQQTKGPDSPIPDQYSDAALQARVATLEREVRDLERLVTQLQANQSAPSPQFGKASGSTPDDSVRSQSPDLSTQDRSTLDFLRDTSINLYLDTYYEYNFNRPVGRVNLLRAYDVLSNEFSLNQAAVIFDHPPDVNAGRRWGGRLDLQFGQATDSSQGNPANEPRPEIYRNIFQAYGSYVLPFDRGVQLDFGKWSSSLGIEGNYTKDQMNYSRSFWFYFLPFYNMGLRTSIPIGKRFSVNYWIVNGTNQVEATNGFKDELWGFTAKPVRSLTWTLNYYLGQEHPDRALATNCGPIPVQPGLCFMATSPAPNGHTDILDSYAKWRATRNLTFAIEGDYFVQRLWQHAAPGESSAPSHVDGGAAYIQYQLTRRFAVATRAEYMSDRGGLFSGITQALKENTVTFDYKLSDGFLTRFEWRRDYSNQRTFLSDGQGVFRKEQTTAGVGLLWWWGRKEGAW